MNDKQRNQDAFYDDTLLEYYAHIQIDQQATETELQEKSSLNSDRCRNIIAVLSSG